jgi:hypothetical protein
MCVWVLGVAHLVFVIGVVLRCSGRLEKPFHEVLAAPARALGAGGAPKQLFLQLLTRGSGFAQRAFVGPLRPYARHGFVALHHGARVGLPGSVLGIILRHTSIIEFCMSIIELAQIWTDSLLTKLT